MLAVNYLLVILLGVLGNTSTAAQKKYGRLVNGRTPSTNWYLVIHSVISIFNFAIMSKWQLGGDKTAVLFGFVYGFICAGSLLTHFIAYKKMNLIMISVFTKGNVVVSWLIGVTVFSEEIKATSVISVLLILIGVLMPLFRLKKSDNRKMSAAAYLLGLLMIFLGGCSTMLTQTYFKLPETTSQSVSVMCFYTNVFFALIMMGVFLTSSRKSGGGLGITGEIKAVKPVYLLLVPICSVCQNLSSVTAAHVLKTMPLSIYTIFSTGASSIILYIFSRFVFKEKVDKYELIAWLIATAAGLITIF